MSTKATTTPGRPRLATVRCGSNTWSTRGTCRCAARIWTKATASSTAPACSCACMARTTCPAWWTWRRRAAWTAGRSTPACPKPAATRAPPAATASACTWRRITTR
ncbi:hypothetical protein G6F24_018521 [Rhizopus arrhizus]|nr:hypothetical protein G6F24_018521 [Rhizopus arrhizus]